MRRYEVYPVADANCDRLHYEPIMKTDNLTSAKHMASIAGSPCGCGIVDNETGSIDFGFGFGVPVPDDLAE
jgi:hypothetical protein